MGRCGLCNARQEKSERDRIVDRSRLRQNVDEHEEAASGNDACKHDHVSLLADVDAREELTDHRESGVELLKLAAHTSKHGTLTRQ